MNLLQRLISPASAETVEVELTRNCFISGNSYAAGDRVQVSRKIADELAAGGAALDRAADAAEVAERDRLAALIPPAVQPQPLPDSWKDLPPAFHDLHAMEEAASALVERRSQIWDKLMATMGRYRALGEGLNNWKGTYAKADIGTRRKLDKVIAGLHIGHLPEAHLAEVRHLKDAYQRSEQAVRDWQADNGDRWKAANFHASQHVMKKHGEVCKAVRELHALGREIFAVRLSALGLDQSKIDELFRCSADAMKYAAIEPPTLGDIKLAWADASGPMYYLAMPPSTMVYFLRGWEATAAEVDRLTKQARTELKKATAVSAAA
jgi:hypothetical protein